MSRAFSTKLLERGLLDRSQVELLNYRARLRGGGPPRHALELGLLSLDEVLEVYAEAVGLLPLRAIDLDRVNRDAAGAFPRRLAERLRIIPVFQLGLRWHVLSDRALSPAQQAEISDLLGVSVVVRALPPFLYAAIASWMRREPFEDSLVPLMERLFPRFAAAAEPGARPALAVTDGAMPSGLPRRLSEAGGGLGVLSQAATHLSERAALTAVWRVDGQTMHRVPSGTVLSMAELEGADRLSGDLVRLKPLPPGWERLLPDSDCDRMVVRPVQIDGKTVALLVLGAMGLPVDGVARTMIEDAANAIAEELRGRIG